MPDQDHALGEYTQSKAQLDELTVFVLSALERLSPRTLVVVVSLTLGLHRTAMILRVDGGRGWLRGRGRLPVRRTSRHA